MSDEKKSILESGGASASSPDKTARIAPGLSAAAPAAKKPLTNTQRVVMAIVSVAAVAIIAVSASFLFAPGEEAFDHADFFKTTQQAPSDEDAAASSEPASDSSEASDEASSDDGTGEAPGVSGQGCRKLPKWYRPAPKRRLCPMLATRRWVPALPLRLTRLRSPAATW